MKHKPYLLWCFDTLFFFPLCVGAALVLWSLLELVKTQLSIVSDAFAAGAMQKYQKVAHSLLPTSSFTSIFSTREWGSRYAFESKGR